MSCATTVTAAAPARPKPDCDLQAFSLFRISFALFMLAYYFCILLPDYAAYFTDGGIIPIDIVKRYDGPFPGFFSLFVISDAPAWHIFWNVLYALGLFGLLIGFRTRISLIICLVVFASFYWRAMYFNSNIERLALGLMAFMLFAPINRYWSVDTALNPALRYAPVNFFGVAGLKTQVCIVYLFSGLFKVLDPHWMNGTAIMLAIDGAVYGAEHGRDVVTRFPVIVHYVTIATGVFQIMFSPLIYSPILNHVTRAIAIFGAFMLHAGILLFMRVGLFPVICMTYLPLFFRDGWIDACLKKHRTRMEKITLYFEPDCGFCQKTCWLFREFCLTPTTPVLPASDNAEAHRLLKEHNSWVVFDGANYLVKWPAVAYVLRQSPFTWIFGVITDAAFLRGAMDALYRWIGNQRACLGKLLAAASYQWPRAVPRLVWVPLNAVPLLMIVMLLITNINSLVPRDRQWAPPWVGKVARYFFMNQSWELFVSPRAWWYHFEQRIAFDDPTINITPIPGKDVPCWVDGGSQYIDCNEHRWQRLFLRISNAGTQQRDRRLQPAYEVMRETYARYVCDNVEKNHGVRPASVHLKITSIYTDRLTRLPAIKPIDKLISCKKSE